MFLTPAGFSTNRNPFRDLERLVEDLASSFQRSFPTSYDRQSEVPLNVWANDQVVVVTAETPGVDPSTIGVNVLGDAVTISGKRPHGAQGETSFTRTVHLPYRVDADRTEARCTDGVLTIALHRPEAERPRTISVKAA